MENRVRTLGICALVVTSALYVVGTVSHGVIRHVVQTLPLWPATWLGFRQSQWSKWVAFPCFATWLFLMTLVWLFLLGWTRMIEGTFTAIEIAMTIVVGAASVIGLATVFRSRTTISWARGIGLALLFAVLQVVALRISFLPGISRDPW